MNPSLAYLLNTLEDEFRGVEDVRVRLVSRSGTQRAADLVQDYDPESSRVHEMSGVIVQTRRKQYFFPEDWFREPSHGRMRAQVREIREALGLLD